MFFDSFSSVDSDSFLAFLFHGCLTFLLRFYFGFNFYFAVPVVLSGPRSGPMRPRPRIETAFQSQKDLKYQQIHEFSSPEQSTVLRDADEIRSRGPRIRTANGCVDGDCLHPSSTCPLGRCGRRSLSIPMSHQIGRRRTRVTPRDGFSFETSIDLRSSPPNFRNVDRSPQLRRIGTRGHPGTYAEYSIVYQPLQLPWLLRSSMPSPSFPRRLCQPSRSAVQHHATAALR